ncbi:MAG: hypothetical protein MTP17_04720 [Candidatus Midichloria sp.]|nr:MAG: hypothetical protein MTP17_04720 [Candidatus Midichloria sp.]
MHVLSIVIKIKFSNEGENNKKILKKIEAALDKKKQELFSKELCLAELSKKLQDSIEQIK